MSQFFDDNLLLYPITKDIASENCILHSVVYSFLHEMATGKKFDVDKAIKCLIDDKGRFHAYSNHSMYSDEGFSRDNCIAVSGYSKLYGKSWNKCGYSSILTQPHYQPQDWAFFQYCSDNSGSWGFPIMKFQMERANTGSSLQLAFVRLYVLKDHPSFYELWCKMQYRKENFLYGFEKYYSVPIDNNGNTAPLEDHPCLKMARKIWS